MILDALIAAIALIAELTFILAVAVIDLVVGLVIYVLALFGKKVERVSLRERRRAHQRGDSDEAEKAPPPPWWAFAAIIAVVGSLLFSGKILHAINYRTIDVAAADGQALPFATFVIERGGERGEVRSTVLGELEIPRRGVTRLTLSDRRYKKQSWPGNEVEDELVVERSLFGKSLDYLLEKAGGE